MILSEKSVEYLNAYFENQKDSFEKPHYKRVDLGIEQLQKITSEINLDKNNILCIRIEETTKPEGVLPHTDGDIGQYTIIIPLKFMEDIETIFFEAFYKGDSEIGFKYRPSGTQYYKNEWLSDDYNNLDGLTGKPFEDKKYHDILSFIDKKDLFGLKIDHTVKWEVGKIIKFKSNQLHCGCNFKQSKRWLLIVTKKGK